MKLLMCVGKYRDVFDANVKIALELTYQLIKLGNDCQIFFLDDLSNSIREETLNGIPCYIVPSSRIISKVINHYTSMKNKGYTKIRYSLFYPLNAILYLIFKNGDKFTYKEYSNFIKEKVKKEKFDYIISFSNPFYPTYSIAKRVDDVKVVYYQCDPFGLHELLNIHTKKMRTKKELQVMNNSSFVFTTHSLYNQYYKHPLYSVYINKMKPLYFPNLNTSFYSYNHSMPRTNDIYFLGTINDSYRNPKKIIDFIMSSSMNITIHFIGDLQSKELDLAIQKYENRIICNHQISNEEALRIINSNVYLLNINNNISNQSPSKLIDYIATGNPIINCIKLPSDSSQNILKQYNLFYNYYEFENNSIKEFDSFLNNNRTKKLKKDAILEKYREYSPEYVAKIINDLLK